MRFSDLPLSFLKESLSNKGFIISLGQRLIFVTLSSKQPLMNFLYHTLSILTASLILTSCGHSPTSTRLTSADTASTLPVAWQSPNIFKKYSATGKSELMNTWTRKLDTSGIAMNDKRTCTLITPRHVVMANHYRRPFNVKVVFHDRRGTPHTRHLVLVNHVMDDVAIGLLNEPLPSSIRAYALPSPSVKQPHPLTGQSVLLTDQNRRVFVHKIRNISGNFIAFKHDTTQAAGYRKNLISGDSGNPSFIIKNGQPVLIETHTTGGPGAGPFYGSAALQAALHKQIQSTDSRYYLKTL